MALHRIDDDDDDNHNDHEIMNDSIYPPSTTLTMARDFTEILPLELRRETYRLVLQRNQAVKLSSRTERGDPEYDSPRLIDTTVLTEQCCSFDASLFRVNKAISQESLAVFFETNAVRVQPQQILDLISRHGSSLRQLHIEADSSTSTNNNNGSTLVGRYLDAAAVLLSYASKTPRLKTVTFECRDLDITVREWLERLVSAEASRGKTLGFDTNHLRCVDVGTYTLAVPEIQQIWSFRYTLLADLWSQWHLRGRQENQPDSEEVNDYFSLRGPRRIPPWAYERDPDRRSEGQLAHNVRGFAHQVASYGAIEAALLVVKSRGAQIDVLRRFELLADWRIKRRVLEMCVNLGGSVRLRGVCREQHGGAGAVLEWATELLAPNTRDFAAAFGQTGEEAREGFRCEPPW